MAESPQKKFGQGSQIRSKSKKEDNEAGLKDSTNKLNSSMPAIDKNEKDQTAQKSSSSGFKNFLFGGFRKAKPPDETARSEKDKSELATKERNFQESGYLTKKPAKKTNDSRSRNKRNITSGRVRFDRLDEDDRVDENYELPTRESIYEILDQVPEKTASYLENRKTGKFSWISRRAVKSLMETKAKVVKPLQEHQEDDIINFINEMTEFYHKLFFFFQGLLSGLCLMHLLLIYLGNEDSVFVNYSSISLRLNQLFHIVSLLSVFGSIFRTMHVKSLYKESFKTQSENLGKDRRSYYKNSLAVGCFFIVYAIVIYTNEFASTISKVSNVISTVLATYKDSYTTWKQLNIVAAVFAFLGWILIVSESDIERPAASSAENDEEENEKDEN